MKTTKRGLNHGILLLDKRRGSLLTSHPRHLSLSGLTRQSRRFRTLLFVGTFLISQIVLELSLSRELMVKVFIHEEVN
jgi:hypothetical protein